MTDDTAAFFQVFFGIFVSGNLQATQKDTKIMHDIAFTVLYHYLLCNMHIFTILHIFYDILLYYVTFAYTATKIA